MAEKLIIDNRTEHSLVHLWAQIGYVLCAGRTESEGRQHARNTLFSADGVLIESVLNEKSERLIVLQREPFGAEKQTEHLARSVLRNVAAPGDLAVGDYVFASDWSDCDWNDPWAIGFVASLLPYGVVIGNEDGGLIDRVGIKYWKFAKRISVEQGRQIIEHYPEMEGSRFDPDVAERWFAHQEV